MVTLGCFVFLLYCSIIPLAILPCIYQLILIMQNVLSSSKKKIEHWERSHAFFAFRCSQGKQRTTMDVPWHHLTHKYSMFTLVQAYSIYLKPTWLCFWYVLYHIWPAMDFPAFSGNVSQFRGGKFTPSLHGQLIWSNAQDNKTWLIIGCLDLHFEPWHCQYGNRRCHSFLDLLPIHKARGGG